MLNWEELKSAGYENVSIYRVKVPGGWLVSVKGYQQAGVTFYPDPKHQWNGNSLN